MKNLFGFGIITLAVAVSGCSVQDTRIPDLAGPSELGLRVSLQAVPDSILQDGFSQATIQIEATGADGRPARGLGLRIEAIPDVGRLSAKAVTTGDDGRARVTYTAPPTPILTTEVVEGVTFRVEPVGTDYRGETPRTVDLRLVVPGAVRPPPPPVSLPEARFTVSGNTGVLTNVVFDASTTTYDRGADQDPVPEFVPCGARCTYAWDFGDGSTGSGIFASHQYSRVGNYQVRLTVTDPHGQTASAAQTVSVGSGGQPTPIFTFSPSAPAVNQQIFFTAEASRAAPGRRLVAYDWNFGSGRTGSGVTTRQTYSATGAYTVTLTVTDDAGNQATTTQSITVSLVGTLQAILAVSPTSGGTTATLFQFDGAQSVPGSAPIVEYRFNFGDGTPDVVTTIPVTTHKFDAVGSYQVSLQVKDALGRTHVARVTVGVAAVVPPAGGGGLQARLTASPLSGPISTNFTFDASTSTIGTSPIVEYVFFFEPQSPGQNNGTNPVRSNVFTTTGTKIVEVRIRDQSGNVSSTSTTVTVQ